MGIAPRIDAGDHIPQDVLLLGEQLDGIHRFCERLRVTANPVVLLLEAVKAHGDAVHATGHQALQSLLVEQVAVGNQTPGVLTAVKFEAHLLEVVAQQGLTTGENNKHLMRVHMRCDRIDNFQEIRRRHVLHGRLHLAVTPAMAATHVATQRTLPKEGAERVQLLVGLSQGALQFQAKTLF